MFLAVTPDQVGATLRDLLRAGSKAFVYKDKGFPITASEWRHTGPRIFQPGMDLPESLYGKRFMRRYVGRDP